MRSCEEDSILRRFLNLPIVVRGATRDAMLDLDMFFMMGLLEVIHPFSPFAFLPQGALIVAFLYLVLISRLS